GVKVRVGRVFGVTIQVDASRFSNGVAVDPPLQVGIIKAPAEEDQAGIGMALFGGETIHVGIGQRAALRDKVPVRVIKIFSGDFLGLVYQGGYVADTIAVVIRMSTGIADGQ